MTFFDILATYKEAFRDGLVVTLKLCAWVWVIGVLVGSAFGMLSAHFRLSFGLINNSVSTIISGVPIIVLLYWMYYPMQQQLNLDIEPFWIAVIAFSIVNVFMVSQLVKNAVLDLPDEYRRSAMVSGISDQSFVWKIQLPLIARQLIGPVLLVQLAMLHNSIFASLINVDDIFRQIQRVNAIVYKPIELYSALALFFIIISVPMTLFANHLKSRFNRTILT